MADAKTQRLLEELNLRLFGLEGRMNTFDALHKSEIEARTTLLQSVLDNQKMADKRLRALEIKAATALGVVLAAEVVLKMLMK